MSQDIDRLIDRAFEHDRERLPNGASSVPESLLRKASVPAAVASGGFIAATWFKIALGVIGVGAVITYYALRPSNTPTATDRTPSGSDQQLVIDSPVVQQDSILPQQHRQVPATTHEGSAKAPSASARPTLMPPILDSGVKIADSIRAPRRAR
jgi:hypothetical protein